GNREERPGERRQPRLDRRRRLARVPRRKRAAGRHLPQRKITGGASRRPRVERQRAASGAGFTPAKRAGGLGGAAQHPPEGRMRRKLIAGNWKMYKTVAEAVALVEE